MATRKLRHYFQENLVTVVSHAPLSNIMNNKDSTGRMGKWAIQLLQFELSYKLHMAVKSQAITDFLVEWKEA